MAFLLHSVDDGHVPPFEYYNAGTGVIPKLGAAMVLNADGKLALSGATVTPGYVCMAQRDSAPGTDELIAVVRVSPEIEFETITTATMTAVKPGQKVTLSADGLTVTATTTSGVAQVVNIDGANVRVRFPG